jgi:acetoin utilization deacetylase AcuC-like enzyme
MTPPPVAVYTHPDCLRHDPGPDQPETPTRLNTILARLEDDPAAEIRLAEPATIEPLLTVHPKDHLERLRTLSESGGAVLAWDTFLDPASWDAVLGATGCVLAAVDYAHHGKGGGHAFCAIRPPGHHAMADVAMGFCLVNNVVVAARRAQSLGRERILIVDWDVHHGNGTQALVEHDETVRFISLHQHPLYPGTGLEGERGVGNIFNLPRPPGRPAETYVTDLWDTIVRATEGWEPHMVLISAGFDAMEGDPLGGFTLTPPDYADLTLRLRERLPNAPIVSLLEGGYNPPVMAEGVSAHIAALG